MIREVHFSSAVYARLMSAMREGGCAALPAFLRTLSVSQFRTAGYMLGERVALEVEPSEFWELFLTLLRTDNRAFLVTMLQALAVRLERGDVSLYDEGFVALVPHFTEVDADKTLARLLPLQRDPDSVARLLDLLGVGDYRKRIGLLLPVGTVPCAYVLFRTLRYVEHDHVLLMRVAALLVRRGDSVSFNLASIMKEYFGLHELRGTFSLHLRPWQLSRLETSYEAFSQALSF